MTTTSHELSPHVALHNVHPALARTSETWHRSVSRGFVCVRGDGLTSDLNNWPMEAFPSLLSVSMQESTRRQSPHARPPKLSAKPETGRGAGGSK